MSKIQVEMNLRRFVEEIDAGLAKLNRGGFKPEINFSELLCGALLHEWLLNLRNNRGSRNELVYRILGLYDEGRDVAVARLALDDGRKPSLRLQLDVLLVIKRHFEKILNAR